MPIKLTADSFLKVLRQSQLVPEEILCALLDELAANNEPNNADTIAKTLVQRKHLTRWQADKVLSGKHRGFILGKFKLLRILGKGGMSTVYLARHMSLGTLFALKVLPGNRVKDTSYLERFQREALASATIVHPHIVRAYDIDSEGQGDNEVHFIVMEYIDGEDLYKIVKRSGPLQYARAVEYIRQAAIGLQFAHESGLIHRDVKPGNFLVDRSGKVRLLDLGLARFFADTDDEESVTVAFDERVLGTADYLAPEQAFDSHTVDARADVYSLGCTFYYVLTGKPPFDEGTLPQRLMAHRTRKPSAVAESRTDMPDSLQKILDRMMLKNADERFQSARDVEQALSNWLQENSTETDSSPRTALPGTTVDSNIHSGEELTRQTTDTGTLQRAETAVPCLSSDDTTSTEDVRQLSGFLDTLSAESRISSVSAAVSQSRTRRGTISNWRERWETARQWIGNYPRTATASGIVILGLFFTAVALMLNAGRLTSRTVSVGPGRDYPTIAAALRAVERYGGDLHGPVVIQLAGGHKYECHLSVDPAAAVYSEGLHLTGDSNSQPAILVGDGIDPVLNIDRISNVIVRNLNIDGGGCSRAVNLTNLSPPIRLSNLEIGNFVQEGIVARRDEDHKSTPGSVEFENLHLVGGMAHSTGLTLESQTRAGDAVSIHDCTFNNHMSNAVRIVGDVHDLAIRESVFFDLENAISFDGIGCNFTDVSIGNNTFCQLKTGLCFRDLVNGKDGSLQILRNIFSDISQTEALAADLRIRNRIRLMIRESSQFNWTTSATSTDEIDLFLEDSLSGIQDFEFASRKPGSVDFMRSANQSLPLTVGRPRRGLKPYVGAMRPIGL